MIVLSTGRYLRGTIFFRKENGVHFVPLKNVYLIIWVSRIFTGFTWTLITHETCAGIVRILHSKQAKIPRKHGYIEHTKLGGLPSMAGLRPLQVYIFEDGNFEISVFAEHSLFSGKFRFELKSFISGGTTTSVGRVVVEIGVHEAIWPYSGHDCDIVQQMIVLWSKLASLSNTLSERLSMPAASHAFMSTWRPRCNLETLLSVSIVRRCTSVTGAIIGAEVVELKEEAEAGRIIMTFLWPSLSRTELEVLEYNLSKKCLQRPAFEFWQCVLAAFWLLSNKANASMLLARNSLCRLLGALLLRAPRFVSRITMHDNLSSSEYISAKSRSVTELGKLELRELLRHIRKANFLYGTNRDTLVIKFLRKANDLSYVN
ncbi:hypothetical protein POM88_013084 [Heracleum sosnowskyi]|uniref:Uncharacterized protein n=1 Tax=Heracleum sosnowskyi TaxID=360622 RepID=A0AAD8IZ85_9APIA|nr:hypothetical protein POM88_013084 [Heracleum sosnowskyi]